jgi:thioesterase domain-containing protein/acyl carrier protein
LTAQGEKVELLFLLDTQPPNNDGTLLNYKPQPYLGRTVLLATEERLRQKPTLTWSQLVTGRLEIQTIPGMRSNYIREQAQTIGEKLRIYLDGNYPSPASDQIRQESEKNFVAPRDELEHELTHIWEGVLGIHSIDVKDNFFDLGGTSLHAVSLFAEIERKFGKNLPLATLFQAATVREIANLMRQEHWLAPWQALVAIQPKGSKPPIFYMHPGGGNVLVYRDLALNLGPEQPVYGLQARGLDGKISLHTPIEDKAAHFLAQIRTVQPEGPYFLAGLSHGGSIAWEMAQQLHAQGEKVALLALFDTLYPGYPQLLPPIPRLLDLLCWAVFDLVRRLMYLPVELVDKLIQLGIKKTWLKILQRLGIVERVLDEDQKIEILNVQGQLKRGIERYRCQSSHMSYLEKWINSLVLFFIQKSSKPYYANILVGSFVRSSSRNLPEALQKVEEANRQTEKARRGVYPGRAILFRAREQPPGIYRDPLLGWEGMAEGGMDVYEIPGTHDSIVKSLVLAEKLKACLEAARSELEQPVTEDRSERPRDF